jgi:Fic family protein
MEAPVVKQEISKLKELWGLMDEARELAKVSASNAQMERPKDGFTEHEYAERYKLCRSTAHAQLLKMVRLGSLKRVKVLLIDQYMRVRATWVYTSIKKTK